MRRRAEIAKHTTEGALNALLVARTASHEALQVAVSLTIDPADVQAICTAARVHVQRIEAAMLAVEAALRSASEAEQVVDRAEITRFGIPVLRPAAQAAH